MLHFLIKYLDTRMKNKKLENRSTILKFSSFLSKNDALDPPPCNEQTPVCFFQRSVSDFASIIERIYDENQYVQPKISHSQQF